MGLNNNELYAYQLSNFLNTLRRFYKKQDIEEVLKTKELNGQQSDQQQNPFEDLNDFLECFCKQIKNQINCFKPTGLANILNGIAHLDVTREDLIAALGGDNKLQSELLEPICGRIKNILLGKIRDMNGIVNFNSVDLANTLNGLVTVFLYDEKTSEKTKGIVLDCIRSILIKANEMDKSQMDDKTKYTFKKNLFYLENVLGLSMLNNDTELNSLREVLREDIKLNDNYHIESGLEMKVEGFLKNKNAVIEVPISFADNSINYFHPIDFTFTHNGKTIYCEIDGPTHFINSNQTEEDKNPQTKIRDQISNFIISKMGENCVYVTVPANKCEKELFFSYINEKLNLEKSRDKLDKSSIASATECKTNTEPKVTVWGKKIYCKPSSFAQLFKEEQQSGSQKIGSSGPL